MKAKVRLGGLHIDGNSTTWRRGKQVSESQAVYIRGGKIPTLG